MRGLIALGCCVLYLAFNVVAGTAHVHRDAAHRDGAHGLHVDHVHIATGPDHDAGPTHRHTRSEPGGSRVEARRAADHGDDALRLDATAQRPSDPGRRMMPATGATIEATVVPSLISSRAGVASAPLRAPPDSRPVPARAPPA